MHFDLKVGAPVAVDVAFDDHKAVALAVVKFAGLVLEGLRSDEREALVAGNVRCGVERRKNDVVALAVHEIPDRIAVAADRAVAQLREDETVLTAASE